MEALKTNLTGEDKVFPMVPIDGQTKQELSEFNSGLAMGLKARELEIAQLKGLVKILTKKVNVLTNALANHTRSSANPKGSDASKPSLKMIQSRI